jgi:amidase
MLRALRAKQLSAVELLDLHLERIERLNGLLNAIVVKDFDRAREAARAADAARARGDDGALLGLSLTVKDSIDVDGLASTGGIVDRANHRAEADAALVARVKAAGGVVLGKTNVPPMLTDWQANNPVYGRTNNPWNLERTPGGSTGGGGAALAAGLTPLEFGSDIGGSIRNPASWCGVYGHRPSSGAVPLSGHFPGSSLPNPVQLLGVAGPLARSADDLDLALGVVAGPDVGQDVAWRLELPPPRHARLADFRVAVLPSIPWLPVGDEMLNATEQVRAALRRAGTRVEEAQPEGLGDLREYHDLYLSLLTAISNPSGREESRALAAGIHEAGGRYADAHACGFEATAQDFLIWHGRREGYRAMWRSFFREWDVLISPIAIVPAPPHTTVPTRDRVTDVNGEAVSFTAQLAYPGISVLAGQPATTFPVGFSADGLPVGLQAMGPYLEDRTTIRFAELTAQEIGGYRRPPGYD